MRLFSLGVVALVLFVVPACNFRSSNAEIEVAPAAPNAIPDQRVVEVTSDTVEEAEPMLFAPTTEPQFVNDPAPAPPTESWSEFDDSLPRESSSAEAVLKSVARVLKGAVDGEDTSERESNGSVLGSIGRALSKGFQEAADSEHTSEE